MLSNLPNILTILRLLAVFPLVYWLLTGTYQPALILAFIAGLSDWVDGVLARRFGWTSRFGGIMDPLADKLMLVSLTLTLAYIGAFPVWLALLIVIRDVVIVAGGVIYKYRFGPVDVTPFRISKWNTGLVIILVLVVMLRLNGLHLYIAGQEVMSFLQNGLVSIVAATTMISGIGYVWVWGAKAIGLHQSAKIEKDDSV